ADPGSPDRHPPRSSDPAGARVVYAAHDAVRRVHGRFQRPSPEADERGRRHHHRHGNAGRAHARSRLDLADAPRGFAVPRHPGPGRGSARKRARPRRLRRRL
ncbi:MAG: hypothetical protein AVDCRST_MAG89-1214, partial [uncultured Gemmatimonadetes bacterium]